VGERVHGYLHDVGLVAKSHEIERIDILQLLFDPRRSRDQSLNPGPKKEGVVGTRRVRET